MSLLGIHPTFPSHFYFIPVSQLAFDRTFVPSCRINKSVPLASGELFTVTVGANTIALFRFTSSSFWFPAKILAKMTNTKNTSPNRTRFFQMNPFGEEEQDQAADKKDKTNDTGLRP